MRHHDRNGPPAEASWVKVAEEGVREETDTGWQVALRVARPDKGALSAAGRGPTSGAVRLSSVFSAPRLTTRPPPPLSRCLVRRPRSPTSTSRGHPPRHTPLPRPWVLSRLLPGSSVSPDGREEGSADRGRGLVSETGPGDVRPLGQDGQPFLRPRWGKVGRGGPLRPIPRTGRTVP